MLVILMSGLLLAAAEPASSPPSPAGAQSAAAQPTKTSKGSEKVCWEERPTGSHLSKTICATRDELDRAAKEAKDSLGGRMAPAPQKGLSPG